MKNYVKPSAEVIDLNRKNTILTSDVCLKVCIDFPCHDDGCDGYECADWECGCHGIAGEER